MARQQTIPTPVSRQFRRLRYQVVPMATMIGCSLLAGWLWMRLGGTPMGVGEVNVVRVAVNSKTDGSLVDVPRKIQMFDTVKAGELIARIDSAGLELQITHLQNQIQQLQESKAAMIGRGRDPATQPNSAVHMAAPMSLASADEANAAGVTVPLQTPTAIDAAIQLHADRIAQLTRRILDNDIKAPISGTIVAIARYPGQAVLAGQPIVTIAAGQGDYIVSYIRQNQAIQPAPGMAVEVRLRSERKVVRSHVESVGPQFEQVPEVQAANPKLPEWGVPVHIAIPQGLKLRPGEMVDLLFHPAESGRGS